jgi:hypothetical protein
MHESAPQPPPSPELIARGHESSTITLRAFVIFLVGLVGTIVVVNVVIWLAMIGFERMTQRRDPEISPLAQREPITPPQPWLQPSPAQGVAPASEAQDLARLRAAEDTVLKSYAVDNRTGSVRIPIDRAMEIFLSRQGATTQPSGGAR